MNENKWIKLHSKITEWEWYRKPNVMRLFVHCLLKANWKESKFMGRTIPRGSFVTSLESLSKELGLSVQQIRTSLKHLISTKELTNESLTQYRIITVVNYELYQQNNKEDNKQLTNDQQTINKQLTTIEEYKNIDYIDNSSSTNNKMSETIFDIVQKEFGRVLSPLEYEIVGGWLESDISEEIIKYAIKESVLSGGCSFRYVQRILERCKQKGIKTVSEAQKTWITSETKSEKESVELFDYNWLEEE